MADWISAEDIKTLIKPGDTVYVGGSTNEPTGLLDQLANTGNLHFIQQPIAAVNKRDLSESGNDCTQDGPSTLHCCWQPGILTAS